MQEREHVTSYAWTVGEGDTWQDKAAIVFRRAVSYVNPPMAFELLLDPPKLPGDYRQIVALKWDPLKCKDGLIGLKFVDKDTEIDFGEVSPHYVGPRGIYMIGQYLRTF